MKNYYGLYNDGENLVEIRFSSRDLVVGRNYLIPQQHEVLGIYTREDAEGEFPVVMINAAPCNGKCLVY